MTKTYFNPPGLFNSKQYGFSQAIVFPANARVFQISGQVALDENEELIGPNDLAAQTRQSLKNLKIAAEAIGAKLKDVTMVRIYMVKPKNDDMETVGRLLRECFGTLQPPASSWIGVYSLARNEFLIEIEASGCLEA